MSESSESTPNASHTSTPGGGGEVDFTTLVISIHEAALMLLGVRSSSDESVDVDPESARYQIAMLSMLEEKTAGNLTEDEERLLKTVLYELRTAYVKVTRS